MLRRLPTAGFLLLAGLGGVLAADRPPAGDPAAWVERRVRDWQPTKAERRFHEVGWLTDIRTAERKAKEHDRPIFLFTHDGRMAVGRC